MRAVYISYIKKQALFVVMKVHQSPHACTAEAGRGSCFSELASAHAMPCSNDNVITHQLLLTQPRPWGFCGAKNSTGAFGRKL